MGFQQFRNSNKLCIHAWASHNLNPAQKPCCLNEYNKYDITALFGNTVQFK